MSSLPVPYRNCYQSTLRYRRKARGETLCEPRLQLPTGDQGSKGSDVLAVGGTVSTPPRLAVAVAGSLLEGHHVGVTALCFERGKNHLERRHELKEVMADDFLTTSGISSNANNPGSSSALVRGDAHSNPRPVAVDFSGRRGW
jgi:hypothetical protein